jgi:eukaryotic-like serine/threonine-protein kinase
MVGATIGHYEILEKMGEGGMGIVYKAHDVLLDRFVAIKFLPQNLTNNVEATEQFIQEARRASAVDHPNICTIYDISETFTHQLFIVMACTEGKCLHERLDGRTKGCRQESLFIVQESLPIITQIAEGLLAVHRRSIVHCDVKPENIFIGSNGQVKLLDFGISLLLGNGNGKASSSGTVAYMSPERIQSLPFDHRTDIWSVGVIFYQLISGRMPFRGVLLPELMYSTVNEAHVPLTHHYNRLPKMVDWIVDRMLAKSAGDRFTSLEEFLINLRKLEKAL